jgi:hypothetical protein
VAEDAEQRAPLLGVDVVRLILDDAWQRMNALDVGLDDPEILAVRACRRLVDGRDLCLQL